MCGFPHSEIPGSKLICSSPRLIAACHVLHRLLMPRHSPYALFRLNFLLYSLFSELLEFLLNKILFSHWKGFSFSCRFSTFRWNCNCLNLLRLYPFWKDSINFSILSSFICSFSNSFKSKYLNSSFTYSIVKFHCKQSIFQYLVCEPLGGLSSVQPHHRVMNFVLS